MDLWVETHRAALWLGINTTTGGPAAYFADDKMIGASAALFNFRSQLVNGTIIKPLLPAVMVRVASRGGKPAVLFYETGQGHVTAAAQSGKPRWTAAVERPVKDRAAVAFAQPDVTEAAIRRKFWDQAKEFYRQLQALSPAQLAQFFAQDRAPLPPSNQLEPKNAEGKETEHDSK